jgi:hypothetical protein
MPSLAPPCIRAVEPSDHQRRQLTRDAARHRSAVARQARVPVLSDPSIRQQRLELAVSWPIAPSRQAGDVHSVRTLILKLQGQQKHKS